MPDTQWYYARENKQEGPVSEAELSRMLIEQELLPSTLVWAEHLERWTAASDVVQFKQLGVLHDRSFNVVPKPWYRLIARMIDQAIYSIPYVLTCAVLLAILNAIKPIERNTAMLVVMPIAILLAPMPYFIESLLMGTLGNTPGKLLFNTRVLNQSGEKLSFLQALQRTGAVWIRGGTLVSYVPVFGFLGVIGLGVYQYTQLVTFGTVSWDRNQTLIYQHGKIGSGRVGALVASVIGLLIWFAILSFSIVTVLKNFAG